jgi:hypothetical protein
LFDLEEIEMAYIPRKTINKSEAQIEDANNVQYEHNIKKEIRKDLKILEEVLPEIDNNSLDAIKELYRRLIAKYDGKVEFIGNSLNGYNSEKKDFSFDIEKESIIENLVFLKDKFQLFLTTGLIPKNKGGNVYNSVSAVALAQADVSINITFEGVKDDIKGMGALPQKEIEEVLKKIDELKEIVESEEKAPAKWDQSKGFLNWLSTKGIDVAMKVIPLLLMIGQ